MVRWVRWFLVGLGLVLFSGNDGLCVEDNSSPAKTFAVTPAPPQALLTPEDKQHLLRLARETLEGYLKEGTVLEVTPEKLSPAIREKKGCFVTLMKNGRLRGCIGYLTPRKALCQCVIENAINAAINDGRFPIPVSLDELGSLQIEISALTVPQRLVLSQPDGVRKQIIPGKDGVILKQGQRESTFLPQVWEHFPDLETFLNALCQKGGMVSGCWEDPKTEIYTYRADIFHE